MQLEPVTVAAEVASELPGRWRAGKVLIAPRLRRVVAISTDTVARRVESPGTYVRLRGRWSTHGRWRPRYSAPARAIGQG